MNMKCLAHLTNLSTWYWMGHFKLYMYYFSSYRKSLIKHLFKTRLFYAYSRAIHIPEWHLFKEGAYSRIALLQSLLNASSLLNKLKNMKINDLRE